MIPSLAPKKKQGQGKVGGMPEGPCRKTAWLKASDRSPIFPEHTSGQKKGKHQSK